LTGSRSNTNRKNASVLAVDDECDTVNLIKQFLEVGDQRVCAFTSPLVALQHFNSDHKDHHTLIISDIRMPGMNGYEFVTKTKQNNPNVKVILMTAFEIQDKEFHNLLPDVKVDAFLQKPFSIQQLNDMIKKISRD
jgi:CheY-like chemotaxis protein